MFKQESTGTGTARDLHRSEEPVRVHTIVIEATIVLTLSVSLGLVSAGIYHKGIFAAPATSVPAFRAAVPAPELIHLEEARRLFESGQALFIDARHVLDFQRGHIRHAINIPLGEFSGHRADLSAIGQNRILVTYCDGSQCNSSMELAALLSGMGYAEVKNFYGGWQEWSSAQLPIER